MLDSPIAVGEDLRLELTIVNIGRCILPRARISVAADGDASYFRECVIDIGRDLQQTASTVINVTLAATAKASIATLPESLSVTAATIFGQQVHIDKPHIALSVGT